MLAGLRGPLSEDQFAQLVERGIRGWAGRTDDDLVELGERLFRPRLSTSSATSGDRAHSTVGALLATIDATVVPQEPPPSTATRGCLRSIPQLTSLIVQDVAGRRERVGPFTSCRARCTSSFRSGRGRRRAGLGDTGMEGGWRPGH